ncbi:hypothetical protein HT031_000984 [Scenedesmus sp. PABB004]|nr:hypothetical protein HT031_000984 [Scenedesmus sp. PABB004]
MAPAIGRLLALSGALRAALIAWGEAQDALLAVRYTDVDYAVFTDAARFVSAGASPYDRATYRYSPLLAWALLPNVLLTRVWGKVLFSAADILAGWQIWRLAALRGATPARAWWAVVAWLYNPFTATISTRGSCDSLVTVLLLGVLLALAAGRRGRAAVLYGLAVHLRLYPILYAPGIVLHLAHARLARRAGADKQQARAAHGRRGPARRPRWACWAAAVAAEGAAFGGLSGAVFVALGGACFALYGRPFVAEAFLHHLGRRDPRHSFSPYYYPAYLAFMPWQGPGGGGAAAGAVGDVALAPGSAAGAAAGLGGPAAALVAALPRVDAGRWAFAPQAALTLAFAGALARDQPRCWLLTTVAFVALNSVSTAQYFVWYFSLLPLVVVQLPWPPPRGLAAAGAAWVVAQLHWLAWAYALEFRGAGVHLALWGAGVLFLLANVACMWAVLDATGSDGGGGRGGRGAARAKSRAA